MAKAELIPIESVRNMESGDLLGLVIGSAEIQVSFPEDAKLADVEQTLRLAVTGYQRLNGAAEKLKPIIGRILLTVKQKKLWKGYYKNFTAFVQTKVVDELGFSRASAFDALKIATAFPGLSQAEYATYGATKLLLATKVTSMSKPDWRQVLKSASDLTVDQFKDAVGELRKTISTARPRPHVVAVRCDDEVYAIWRSLTEGTEDIQALFKQMLENWQAATAQQARKPKVLRKQAGKPASTHALAG